MNVPYITALIRRDAMNTTSVKVLAHEVAVLGAVHGEEGVTVVPSDQTLGGRTHREITSPRQEWERLLSRYGVHPDTGVEFVSIAFGTPRQLQSALEEAEDLHVEYVESPGFGDAAEVEVEPELSGDQVESVLDAERKAQGFEPSQPDPAVSAENALLKQQNEALMQRLAQLEQRVMAGDAAASMESGGAELPEVLPPVTKMSNEQLRAELESNAVEYDPGANHNQLRALVSSVRDAAVPPAA